MVSHPSCQARELLLRICILFASIIMSDHIHKFGSAQHNVTCEDEVDRVSAVVFSVMLEIKNANE